jgi:hypothetical protein
VEKQALERILQEKEAEYASESELVVQDNAVVLKKQHKKSNWIMWILSVTAVYFIINPFQTNQK